MSGRLPAHVGARNALFQQWSALAANRSLRTRSGQLLVQGVRPVTLAVRAGVVQALLRPTRTTPSAWAREMVDTAGVPIVEVDAELLAELGGKQDGPAPELVALAGMPADDLERIDAAAGPVLVLDRPASPGNIGTLIRSADAFGAAGVVVAGHAADPWDPRAVRASTGSVFTVPVVRVDSAADVLAWAGLVRTAGIPVRLVGTDESGAVPVGDADLGGPLLLVVGTEATGMSRAWRDACELTVSIPIGGGASSLNAAAAGSVVLYEIARQRAARVATTTRRSSSPAAGVVRAGS